jgi:HD superfamily phosphohydrolase
MHKIVFKETIDNVIHRRFMLYTEFYYSKDAKAADRMISDALQIASKRTWAKHCAFVVCVV